MEPTANTEEISLTAVQSTSEPPSTPSQGLYGLTKKLFNYVSGSNTPETTNKTTATDLSGKIVSAVSTPSLEVKFNSLKGSTEGQIERSQSQSSLPGFADLARSSSVDDFMGETLMSTPAADQVDAKKSASLHTLHSYSMQSTGSFNYSQQDQSTLNMFQSTTKDSSEEECLFAAVTQSAERKKEEEQQDGSKKGDENVDYDDGEVIVNMRARPPSVQSMEHPTGTSSMQSLLPAQLASSVVGIAQTPVKAQVIDDMAQELAAVELASPQLLFSPPLAVAGPQQIPQSPFLSQSPTKQTSSSPQKSPVKSTTPQLSPQRLVTVPMTPLSVLKYTEKDLISFKSQWQQQHEKELEVLHQELRQLDSKHRLAEESRTKMKQVVDEFEAAMAKMIDDSRQEKERHAILMEKMADERNRVQTELKTVENAFKDHRVRYEEMKMLNEQYRKNETMLRQTIEKLQQDVKSSEQRVNAVKDHAEKKLKEASEEIYRVQQANETEIMLLKAKLQKADLKLKAVEQNLEQKQTENKELMGICDELIKKIEGQKS